MGGVADEAAEVEGREAAGGKPEAVVDERKLAGSVLVNSLGLDDFVVLERHGKTIKK